MTSLFPELEKETITCYYGPPASGKSTICFEYISRLQDKDKKIYYVDTEGGFSPERVLQINPQINLDNIIVFKVKKFDEQTKLISNLLKQTTKKDNISLIIIDSLVMLYRLKLADKPFKINNELAEQLRQLREIAINLEIPILVTNQMYKHFDTNESKMVGGTILEYWCKTVIELDLENNKRKIILKKHRHKPVEEINFEILNTGLKEKKKFNLFG